MGHHVEFENAVLVRPDVAALLQQGAPEGTLERAGLAADDKAGTSTELLRKYSRGYFCHPLRGVLNYREDVAQHDFRPWLDQRRSAEDRLREAHDFLNDAWRRDDPASSAPDSAPQALPF